MHSKQHPYIDMHEVCSTKMAFLISNSYLFERKTEKNSSKTPRAQKQFSQANTYEK
jgi:hypothetical protein